MQKILIVEDDEKLRHELKVFLDKNGFDAIEFDNFENPVENILDENADLVLLDINLPFSDGKFICNEIRKVSDVPIIMITSINSDIDELISLNYGADQYVTKPFNIQILLAKITGLLKRSNNSNINLEKINCGKFILNISQSMIEKDDKKIEIYSKDGKENIALYIKDNGIGMKKEEIGKAFEKGFTGENGRIIGKKSTGIGLYLCKKLCDKLGLKIELDSKKNEGTEVKIVFPKNSFTDVLK